MMNSPTSPQVTIRRPADFHMALIPLTPHSNPYPRESVSRPFQIAAPVIVTPIETRSTRDIIRGTLIRRVRKHRISRDRIHQRRLSLMNTPTTLPRGKRIEKNSPAIDMECDRFRVLLSEFGNSLINTMETFSKNVPTDSLKCAKLREINRLETIDWAITKLTVDCEYEILEAIARLEGIIGLMKSELDTIAQILDFERNEDTLNCALKTF